MKALKITGFTLAGLLGILFLTVNLITYHPGPVEEMEIQCSADAPELQPGQEIKVMNWNIQYLAGKSYVYWYDVSDGSGMDLEPAAEEVKKTLGEFLKVVREERPDILLLQEVHVDAKATDYMDQVTEIVKGLGPLRP